MTNTVCLTFDLDAVSLWVTTFRSSSPSSISRGEYGPQVGLPRILDLLARRAISATFFVPGMVAELYPDSVRRIQDAGHELATHGDRHERHVGMERQQERAVIERGIDRLVKVTGTLPAGFRAPGWELSFETIGILAEMGLRYDSSLFSTDFTPHRPRMGDRVEHGEWTPGTVSPLWEIPIAWELDDVPYFLIHPPNFFGTTEPDSVLRLWKNELDFMTKHEPGGVFTLTLHPQIIGRGPRLIMLERLLEHAEQSGCRFGTMSTVVEHLEQK